MATLTSEVSIKPCYKDICSFVLRHDDYPSDKPILVNALSPSDYITRAEAEQKAYALIHGLRTRGMKKGDTVCIVHANHILYPVIFLGILGAGGRYTGANPSYTAPELSHHFRISETQIIITSSTCLDTVRTAIASLSWDPVIYVWDDDASKDSVEDHANSYPSIHTLLSGEPPKEADLCFFDDEKTAKETIAVLMSTSGTTGLPKMAARSHFAVVMEGLGIEDEVPKTYEVRRLLFTPFFHGFTAPLALISALRRGHQTFILPRSIVEQCLAIIQQQDITETALPPAVLLTFLSLDATARSALKNLHTIWSGGAPIPSTLQTTAQSLFHPLGRLTQVYGLTEGGWTTTFAYPTRDDTGSVGHLINNYSARLHTPDGVPITTDDIPGLLSIKGPANMLCYFNNPTASAGALDAEGWLATGDIAAIRDGKLYILDRQKDMLKVRGWQVSPSELEARMVGHPLVVDAAVVGAPDIVYGTAMETPRCYVVLDKDAEMSVEAEEEIETQLVQWMRDGLAKYKVMDLQVRFTEVIPRSVAGKILREKLREEVKMEIGEEVKKEVRGLMGLVVGQGVERGVGEQTDGEVEKDENEGGGGV